MSTRNSREAKAGRRAQRQDRQHALAVPGISRARIAEAVHRAVCEVTGTDGFGMCQLYARAGAAIATIATGRPYMWQAGELRIGTGDFNDDGELFFAYSPEASGYSGTEFHCWVTRRPAGQPGAVVKASPLDEYADFGMRHLPRAISMSGFPWNRGPLPEFFWGTYAGLRRLRVEMITDPAMMTYIMQSGDDGETARRTAAAAVRHLGITPREGRAGAAAGRAAS